MSASKRTITHTSISVWLVLLSAAIVFASVDAVAGQKQEFVVLHVLSPDAREIVISDKAKLDDVLQVLKKNGVEFNGPVPIISKASGDSRTVGHRLEIRLDTYNPRGSTDPDCPYRQLTELRYDLEGRLYEYMVLYSLSCVK